MTFSELKFKLKREGSLGHKTFYTVPKVDFSNENGTDKYVELPMVLGVDVNTNKHGKKILDFDTGGFGGNPEDMHFFLDKEMADVYSAKIQVIKHTKLIKALRDFEFATKINSKLDGYLDKYPEVFL